VGYGRKAGRRSATSGKAGSTVAALVVVCGAILSSIGTDASISSAASDGSRTPAAESFAQRVLDEATVPSASRPTEKIDCQDLAQPSQGVSNYAELIGLHRLYLVDESPGVVEAYLTTHLPSGAKVEMTVDASGCTSGGLGVALPVSGPHDYLAYLDYSLAPVGSGTELRVDAWSVWLPSRSRAEMAPTTGLVEVTGYAISPGVAYPSSGPVTFTLSRAQAGPLIDALNALPLGPESSDYRQLPPATPICGVAENRLLYKIVVRPTRGAPPSFEADGWVCLMSVVVTVHGRRSQPLTDNCSLLRSVARVLPPHEANGTREIAASCVRPGAFGPGA
jgi:hypothetical protein